jgi:uncharacterized membrane protein
MLDFLSEATLRTATLFLVRIVEAGGVLVIFVGAMLGLVRFVLLARPREWPARFMPLRLDVGRFLALGLEFQLAADLLRTAVSPTFQEIAKLACVAAIRTALNYFLSREIREERAQVEKV